MGLTEALICMSPVNYVVENVCMFIHHSYFLLHEMPSHVFLIFLFKWHFFLTNLFKFLINILSKGCGKSFSCL